MKLWQLLLCATMVACSGDDDGPKPAADAGDGGPGADSGDACVGDTCAPAGPRPLGEERLFEPNASVLGRVVSASGAPLTGYAVQVFDIPSTGAARSDVSFAPAVDGSFRLRLTGIPSQAPEGTPPAHVVLKISAPGALTAAREVVLHPREVTDLGSITLILRDPKVTVIGAAGGTATDSSGEVEVVIPPGALSANVPVQITPIRKRAEFPVPLPDATLTTYGFELEPDGQTFAQPVTVRVANTRAVPTSLKIPVGVASRDTGAWDHEGLALWDGTKWSAQTTHFCVKDYNPTRSDTLVVTTSEGGDPHDTKTCPQTPGSGQCTGLPDGNGFGSSVGLGSGVLKVAVPLPSFARRGGTVTPTLVYASNLAGTFMPRVPGSEPPRASAAVGGNGMMLAGRSALVQLECMEREAADGLAATNPNVCVTDVSCSRGGMRFTFPTNLLASGLGITEQKGLPGDPQSGDLIIDGAFEYSGDGDYLPAFFTQNLKVSVAGVSSCAGGGASFGSSVTRDAPVTAPLEGGPLATFERSVFVPHRLASPFGVGWSISTWSRIFRDPRGSQFVRMDASGGTETFVPRVFTKRVNDETTRVYSAVTTDVAGGGEVFAYAPAAGKIVQVADDGTVTDVISGVSLGAAFEMATTVSGGVRHFLFATGSGLFDASSSGVRSLVTSASSGPFRAEGLASPSITARGDQVVYTAGNPADARVYALRLSAPTPAPLSAAAGDFGLDPHAALGGVQFDHPRGVAFDAAGALYVADRRRNAVYRVDPSGAGIIDGTSRVVRAFGDGQARSLPPAGLRSLGPRLPVNQPLSVRVAPDGAVFASTLTGLVHFDPRTGEAAYLVIDGSDPKSEHTAPMFVRGESFAAASASRFLRVQDGWLFREDVRFASEHAPTRSVSLDASGATSIVDTESDEVESFDVQGRVVLLRTRSGDPLGSYEYASPTSGRVVREITPAGDATTYEYDGGRVVGIVDPAGRRTSLSYGAAGDLARVVLPDASAHTFEYVGHKIVKRSTPRGDVSEYTFAADGTVRATKKPAGEKYTIEPALVRPPVRDANGDSQREGTYTDAHGVQHVFLLNKLGEIVQDRYVADGVPYVRGVVFDDIMEERRPSLFGGSIPQDGIARRNTGGRVRYQTVNGLAVGGVTEWDPLGRVSELYAGLSVGFASPLDVRYLYRDDGRVEEAYFGGNNAFRYVYDADGRLTQVNRASGGVESKLSYRADGQVATATNRGLGVQYDYDAFGLPNKVTDSLGRAATMTHDAAGNVTAWSDGQASGALAYDSRGRPVERSDAAGNRTTFGYAKGEDFVTTIHTPDLPAGKDWAFQYGPEGRLVRATDPDGRAHLVSYAPTGEVISTTDPNGRIASASHDQLGRVVSTVDALNRAHAQSYPVPQSAGWQGSQVHAGASSATRSSLDPVGSLGTGDYQIGTGAFSNREMVSRGLPRTTFYRDATFELVYAHDYLNPHGQLYRRGDLQGASPVANGGFVDLPGTKSGYSHYAQGFDIDFGTYLTGFETDRPGGFSSTSVAYDADRFVRETTGHTASVTDTVVREPGGRVTGVSRLALAPFTRFADAAADSAYGYQANGYLSSVTNGDGTHTISYDARGLPETMVVSSEGTYRYVHDALGRNTRLTYPDLHTREQVYDAQGRIRSRCYKYPGAAAPDRCYTATYDGAGNPVTMVDPEGTDAFEVDNLDRLTKVTRKVTGEADVVETLGYNALGALRTHAGGTLDDQRPRRTGGGKTDAAVPASVGARAIAIDPVGQVTQIGDETLSWNRLGLLERIRRPAGAGTEDETYAYDAQLRRVRVARGPTGGAETVTYYAYEGDHVAAELGVSPSRVLRSWLYDGVDHPLRLKTAGAVTAYYELDLAGNVRRLRAPGGADLGGYRYAAFGKQLAADAKTPAPTVEQPLRWKGRWWSDFGGAAGTYDMRARIWAPELGVFLSIDEFPYHDARGTLWSWPNENPVSYSDPTGHIPEYGGGFMSRLAAADIKMQHDEPGTFAAVKAAGGLAGFSAVGGPAILAWAANEGLFAAAAALIRSGSWGRLVAGLLLPSLGNLSGGGGGCSGAPDSGRQALVNTFSSRLAQQAGFGAQGRPIVLDENLSSRGAAEALRQAGYNVRSVQEIFGTGGIKDAQILQLAQQIGARVLTADRGRDVGGGFGSLAIAVDARATDVSSLVRYLENSQ